MYWWWATKVLNFVENMHIIKDNLFEIPLIFDLIQKQSKVEFKEMYSVFNMGHRNELYTDHKTAITIIDIAKFDVDAKIIGYCEPSYAKNLL